MGGPGLRFPHCHLIICNQLDWTSFIHTSFHLVINAQLWVAIPSRLWELCSGEPLVVLIYRRLVGNSLRKGGHAGPSHRGVLSSAPRAEQLDHLQSYTADAPRPTSKTDYLQELCQGQPTSYTHWYSCNVIYFRCVCVRVCSFPQASSIQFETHLVSSVFHLAEMSWNQSKEQG